VFKNVSKSPENVIIEVWFGGENVSLNIEFIWINNLVKCQYQR
jgi:hypothetical protein